MIFFQRKFTTFVSGGVEGEDYQVGDDGLFYRTKEQRAKAAETDYKASHACSIPIFHSMTEPVMTV